MKKQQHIQVNENVVIGNDLPMVLIAGPCQLESRDHAMEIAEALVAMTHQLGIPFIFKTSFDKANRSSMDAKRGVGFEKALPIFQEIRNQFQCPVLTDVHAEAQCGPVAKVVDILQIPAFLCRQTDLLIAAAKTEKTVNVKKGQFLAPSDMINVIKKIEAAGNHKILLTERGTSFGYNNLIVDPCSIPIMSKTGYPTVIDATHAVQQPGGLGTATGGDRAMAPVIARCATANGVAGIFIETHEDPDRAPSDGQNMILLNDLPDLLKILMHFDEVAKANPVRL